MQIQHLEVRNFRNYHHQTLEFDTRVNIFFGDNGQGKTNLLEAIYLLTRGTSFRPASRETLINARSEWATLAARLHSDPLTHDIKLAITEKNKQFQINGKKTSAQRIAKTLPSVLFSPESLAVIKEGPESRRQLVDDFLLSANDDAAATITGFHRCLKTRNRLLRDFKKGLYPESVFWRICESLNRSYLPLAVALTELRINFLRAILPDLREALNFLFSPQNVDISVDYVISSRSALAWGTEEIAKSLSLRLREMTKSEIESGMSLVGPHKHDIRFLFAGEDARYYCSQGQQRSLILSVKMAQIMYHQRVHRVLPVLLLDDVLSELDADKRAHLVAFLKRIKPQIFLTSTELSFPHDFGDKEVSAFKIEKGSVARQER